MSTRTILSRMFVSALLTAGFLAATQNHGNARDASVVGPPLEAVKTFGNDFRLVGIGVSAKGRVFATAPSSRVRSSYSMVEVDPQTGAISGNSRTINDSSANTSSNLVLLPI